MPDKVFIDTNIVVYSLGENSLKAHQAAPLFVGLPTISTQVVSETANVAAKRLGLKAVELRKLITVLESMCKVEIVSLSTIHKALDVHDRYRFSWYDSLIIASALESGCKILYTEDMQHGQIIEGALMIQNPFLAG